MENLPIDSTLDEVMRTLGYYGEKKDSKETAVYAADENLRNSSGKRIKGGIGMLLLKKKLSLKKKLCVAKGQPITKKIQRKASTGTLKSSDTGYDSSSSLTGSKKSKATGSDRDVRTSYALTCTEWRYGYNTPPSVQNSRLFDENLNKSMRIKRTRTRAYFDGRHYTSRPRTRAMSSRRQGDSDLYNATKSLVQLADDESTGKSFILEKFLNDQITRATSVQRPPRGSRPAEWRHRSRTIRSRNDLISTSGCSLGSSHLRVAGQTSGTDRTPVQNYSFDMNGTLFHFTEAKRRHTRLRREMGFVNLQTPPNPEIGRMSGVHAANDVDSSASWMRAVSFDCSLMKTFDYQNTSFGCALMDRDSEGNDVMNSMCWEQTDVMDESVDSLMTSKSDLENDLLDITYCDKYLFNHLLNKSMEPIGEILLL